MATITIRNLSVDVESKLRARAAQNARSIEAEAGAILSDAVGPSDQHNIGQIIRDAFACDGGADLTIAARDTDVDTDPFSHWAAED